MSQVTNGLIVFLPGFTRDRISLLKYVNRFNGL